MASDECNEDNTINITEETVSEWLYTPTDNAMITVTMPIIWCVGLLTNLSLLFVVYRVPTMRSETNVYLANTAVTDILFPLVPAIMRTWKYLKSPLERHLPFISSAQCAGYFGVMYVLYYVGIGLVTMVSYERYIALCHPLKHLKIRGRRRTCAIVAMCWLMGLVFGGITCPYSAKLKWSCLRWPQNDKYEGLPSSYVKCGTVQPWLLYVLFDSIHWLIALVTNVYMYVRIVYAMKTRKTKDMTSNRKDSRKSEQQSNQVARMLVVNGTVFFLCQAPIRVVYYSVWASGVAGVVDPLRAALGKDVEWIGTVPLYLNSAINPLIYSAMSAQYRAAFRRAFQRSGRKQKRPTATHLSRTKQARNLETTMESNNAEHHTHL